MTLKAWDPHFLDEFVLISSNGTQVMTKADRLKTLSQARDWSRAAGIGSCATCSTFPSDKPETIVMIARAQGYSGKPVHISRIWAKRDGMWRMAFSYQTTIQSAPSVMPK